MNAAAHMVSLLPSEAIRRLAVLRTPGRGDRREARGVLDVEQATAQVTARWGGDLCGLLNALTRGELAVLALQLGVAATLRAPALRAALWDHGAALERGTVAVSRAVQPRPIVLGGHLVIQAPPRGLYPPSAHWPRIVPPRRAPALPPGEPETLDELLAAADRMIGVRLGARGRDKGAWGIRAARLLGVVERNEREPDWRGDVEVKTVAIARDRSGWWRVVEDPAIAMVGEPALAKLARTLWLARTDVAPGEATSAAAHGARRDAAIEASRGAEPEATMEAMPEATPEATIDAEPEATIDAPVDATIVSWYLLDWDPEIARLARRDLHERPKGPAGTDARGLYLHKRFFADAGLLATLNGDPEQLPAPDSLDAPA